ncbi:MAG: SpoIIE family protein phosphatase [Candidatus Krumholzibacteriaceae bacterium]|jgi:sigma-B regulation protein RsbU (phosphoserine phosphatase)
MISVPRIAIVVVAVLIAVLGTLGFRDYVRSPYTGIQDHNLVIRAIEAESPNRDAGLSPGDRIVAVNGTVPRNRNHYASLVAADRTLKPLVFMISRGDSTFRVSVRCVRPPALNVSGQLSLLVAGFTFILVGLVVIMKRPDILGTLFTVNCVIFSFLISERPVTAVPLFHILGELAYDFLFIFLPALFLHFFLLFPGREIEHGTRRARLLRFLYVPPVILSLSTFVLALWQYSVGAAAGLGEAIDVLNALTVLYWGVYIVASLAVFIRTYIVSEKVQRVKFGIVIVGVVVGIVPITVLMLLKQFQPTGAVPMRYMWAFSLSFMSISSAYAILKRDAFDLGIVVQKSLVYGILLVFGVGVYYAFVALLGGSLLQSSGVSASLATGAAIIVAVLAIVPVRRGIQAVVDRAFYRTRKVFKDDVISFSRQIQYLLSLDEVCAFVTREMLSILHAEHVHLFLREDEGNFSLKESAPPGARMPLTSFPPGTGLIALMREERLPVMLEYFDRLWINHNLDRISREAISISRASVAVPLLEQNELLGFVLVGRKSSGKPYTRSDAEVLELLGGRSAGALINMRLCRASIERERFDEELHLASDIQARLLPESPPLLDGAVLVAGIRTSREVGGDFYDFVELGPRTVGIAVADVSGKGIPGALLMTTLQASFRAESPKSKSPAAVVTALNQSLYDRSDTGKFATLFYAIYDDSSGIVTYSNAGSNPPFILSADGKVNRLQRGGLIIGIERGSSYSEGIVKLKPGDLLVIYTDGFIDQEGPDEEPFGEKRLLEFFRHNLHLSADSLIERLFATSIAFGQNNVKDDMTIVLLRRNPA